MKNFTSGNKPVLPKEEKPKEKAMTSFVASIVMNLAKFADKIPLPDSKHNVGKLLAQAYLWDTVVTHAQKQSDQLWATLESEGLIPNGKGGTPGSSVVCESPKFVCNMRITEPVRRFSSEELGKLLKASKYKVPEPITREFVEQAKVPTKSSIVLNISER